MIKRQLFIENTQDAMLEKISKPRTRVTKGEHVRRALDVYLSTQTVQEELAGDTTNSV